MLKSHEDGLTRQELSDALGIHITNVKRAIKAMPDAYVDRWVRGKRNAFQKVYCVVKVPEDCPHPKDQVFRGGCGKPKTVWVTLQ
jgi:glycosyltransferase A (GT-A) superfamily protein (DUF2064 family)